MSTHRSPSLIPSAPVFPFILPQPPQPHPTPLPQSGKVKLSSRRNLEQEANDLSDEEAEVDDSLLFIRNRGANYLIPLGRRHTLMEERADAQGEDSETSNGSGSDGGGTEHNEDSGDDDDDEEEAADLDADMEDLDRETEEDDEDADEDGGDEDGDEDGDGEDDGDEGYGGHRRNYW